MQLSEEEVDPQSRMESKATGAPRGEQVLSPAERRQHLTEHVLTRCLGS